MEFVCIFVQFYIKEDDNGNHNLAKREGPDGDCDI